ncbi:MAG: carbon-nitrogen hydrolase family protein [Candidatus Geothermincolia bacterium]
MAKKVKVAAIQLCAKLGDVEGNLERSEQLVEAAFAKRCRWVILPEFFTTAMGFHPDMLQAALPFDGPALQMLRRQAQKHEGYVGGSFISSDGKDRHNTFVLAFPNGDYVTHNKDLPTMWENCWYRGGSDPGILETPEGPVGSALCWELVRGQTVKRLRGRVGLLVGGSCWWTVPMNWYLPWRGFWNAVHMRNFETMVETPTNMARLLGVPFIHAAHAGDFECSMPLVPGVKYKSYWLGETQILDARGGLLARMKREDGEGFITASVEIGAIEPSYEHVPDRLFMPNLPWQIKLVWFYQNLYGRWYYDRQKKRGALNL